MSDDPPAAEQIIEVVRSGGFAGIERRGSIALADLETPVAAALRAQFDDVPSGRAAGTGRAAGAEGTSGATSRSGSRGADRFAYELSWITGGRRRVVHVAEQDLPSALRQLIDASLRPAHR